MSKQQWTVVGLLALLLGLEVVRSQNVRGFFTGAWSNFQSALGAAGNVIGPPPLGPPKQPSGGIGTPPLGPPRQPVMPSSFPASKGSH